MTSKSERTRDQLIETALQLFRELGYEKTTMRRIATEAGVSTGNAYYYFSGKDELVQQLYGRIQEEHRALAEHRLRRGGPLTENLTAVLHAGMDTMTPYHSLGSTMLQTALSPTASVSPFSAQSAPARSAAVKLMSRAVQSSRGHSHRTPDPRLAQLLWLAYLGVTLHWVTDNTPEQARTRALIDGVAPLLSRVIALSRLPVGRRLAEDAYALIDRLTSIRPVEKDPS